MASEVPPFEESLKKSGLFPLKSSGVSVFQMNLGRLCNQACKHCHVNAGPNRKELMANDVIKSCLSTLEKSNIEVVDITGGSPEMHPGFRNLVKRLREMGKKVMSRCNLTICTEDGYGDIPEFYRDSSVYVVASLPYFREEETDRTRGRGVFKKSLKALKRFNEIGYGMDGSGFVLDLVYNPAGLYFPPPQNLLEADFKRELGKRYGLVFNSLLTMINMPVGRFADFLERTSNYDFYMKKLVEAYNPSAACNVMCKNTLSVNWEGDMYDCDFNQMLGIKVNHGAPSHISNFDAEVLNGREIMTGPHCYGCTAGSGSSCGGATAGE